MNILVTGGAGFIGSHLCRRLSDSHRIVCLDNFNDYYDPAAKRRNIEGLINRNNFLLIEGDILDRGLIMDLFSSQQFDVVVHLAARAGVRPSIKDPLLYQRVNIEGTLHLLDAAVETSVEKFLLASSSSVYGKNEKVPFAEDDFVDNPISPYAATKKACELMAYTYHSLYQLPVTCLRFFTVYGPGQRPDMAIHKFTRMIDRGEKIPVFGDGHSRRDYTYIDDIIQGILRSIERCSGYHIYNLGESTTIELIRMIELLEKGLGKKAHIEWLDEQPGDVPITYADISRAKNELDYNPVTNFEDGIEKFIHWYLETGRKGG